jgi:hypothetical protein
MILDLGGVVRIGCNEQRCHDPKGNMVTRDREGTGGLIAVGNIWIGDENTRVYYQ